MTESPSLGGPSIALGRTFVGPWFDTLLIGGGLSLIVGLALKMGGVTPQSAFAVSSLPFFILLSNSAHFAASTVRLYTKPGAYKALPFVTMGFPVVTLGVLTLAIVFAEQVGRHLNALYLTWSPYHYAAQAYGLAVMYCYRSGCNLKPEDKRLMKWTCMLPFFWAFARGGNSGLGWFVSESFMSAHPAIKQGVHGLAALLAVATFAMPVLLFYRMRVGSKLTMPAISLLVIVSNGIWWIVFSYIDAFVWATVFHCVQYVAIVTIFHVKDQLRRPGNHRGRLYHSVWFYGVCVILGYLLFNVWPHAYVLAGFGLAESMLLTAAVVSLHHFIVDGYIWKLKSDPNFETVTGGASAGG